MKRSLIKLKELERAKVSSIDPRKYPDNYFSLYSIPAYDLNKAEILLGSKIGSSKKILKNGDVLLSKIIPHIRRVWVIENSDDHQKIGSGEWIVFNSEKIFPSFLKHYLLSDLFHLKFMNTVSGVGGSLLRAQPRLIGEFDFLLPSIVEQKNIATILDIADGIVKKRKKTITKFEELIESFFKKFFNEDILNPKLFFDFNDIIIDVTKKFLKIKSKDYKVNGSTPIVDQGAKEICGYTHLKIKENNLKPPYIIFGDHTRRIKFANYNFILGADGTKVLKSKIDVDYTFLFYYLKSLNIESAGYARHFKFFKSKKIFIPSIEKQKKFSEFKKNCEIIFKKNEILKRNDELLDSLKNSFFKLN
jgi:hypothetical protein